MGVPATPSLKGSGGFQHHTGSMATMSGADDAVYRDMEYSTAKSQRMQHPLFRPRQK